MSDFLDILTINKIPIFRLQRERSSVGGRKWVGASCQRLWLASTAKQNLERRISGTENCVISQLARVYW
jgi:hypothetical protein